MGVRLPARQLAAAVLALALAFAAAGCGDDEDEAPPARSAGPFLVTPDSLREALTDAGVTLRRTGPASVLAQRSLPLPRRSQVLRSADGTRLSVLFYDSPEMALGARASVRDAVDAVDEIVKVDNVLVVVEARGPDLPEIRSAFRRLTRASAATVRGEEPG